MNELDFEIYILTAVKIQPFNYSELDFVLISNKVMCCPANLVLAGSSGLQVPKPVTMAWLWPEHCHQ